MSVERALHFLLLGLGFGLGVGAFSLQNCYLLDGKAMCSSHKLNEIPADLPPSVLSIDLSSNNISNVRLSDFARFPNVTSVNLKENAISYVGKRAFSELTSLKRLSLSRNRIEILTDEMFYGLSKLKELYVNSNRVRIVEMNAFRPLRNLAVLALSHNKLRAVAQVHLQHLPLLNLLFIQNCSITTFRSRDLTNASTRIKTLDLSENPLEKFEVSADVFPQLTELNVGNRTVKSNLTFTVQNRSLLSHVTSLDISGARLASVDDWTRLFSAFNSSVTFLNLGKMRFKPEILLNLSCSLSNLRQLQIQSNSLIIGPNLFRLCGGVTKLDLGRNNIKKVKDGSFSVFRRLQSLILSSNSLQKVPSATRNLKSLRELDLSFNHIKTIGCRDFTGLENLKGLNLQKNKITALSNCSFLKMNKLEDLNLQENSITELGSAFQSHLPNLKSLFLARNKITAITRGEFSGLNSLKKLFLAQNQIRVLYKGCFSGLANLEKLHLKKNFLKNTAFNCLCFGDLLNLQSLNLENNHFKLLTKSHFLGPPFQNLTRLESLKISGCSITGNKILPSDFLQGLTNLQLFSCNKWEIGNFSANFFQHTPRLSSLDISSNSLYDLSSELFAPIPNLKKLKISNANLRSLDFLITANLTNLTSLSVENNGLSVIGEDIIRSVPSLLEFDLKRNSFACDCENAFLIKWIINDNRTQVRDAHSFVCSYRPEQKNSKLLQFNVQSCLVHVDFLCFICTSCLTALTLVVSFVFHFSRFHLSYAYYLFLAWLFDSRNRQKRAESLYDAFVSYNSRDEAWVCEELVPRLEQEQGWRLCLHHRDFLPGKPIVENIAEAVYRSRKTICVVSRWYLQSEWCSKELQLARYRLSTDLTCHPAQSPHLHLLPLTPQSKISPGLVLV
uniref:Toll-like receptor 22b n=1 Tax=Boleophthalmus pectinirostris TaxID=150288 RepID=A0A482I902_BOLPE|nr:toll-like receptor 22b [Boleophthalmus pectinirostris]